MISTAKRTVPFSAANPCGTGPRARPGGALGPGGAEVQWVPERFQLETRWAVQPLDLLREPHELRPALVHFSGQRSPDTTAAPSANLKASMDGRGYEIASRHRWWRPDIPEEIPKPRSNIPVAPRCLARHTGRCLLPTVNSSSICSSRFADRTLSAPSGAGILRQSAIAAFCSKPRDVLRSATSYIQYARYGFWMSKDLMSRIGYG